MVELNKLRFSCGHIGIAPEVRLRQSTPDETTYDLYVKDKKIGAVIIRTKHFNIQAELILGQDRALAPVLEIFEHTSPSLAIAQGLQVAFLQILSNWSYEEVQTFLWSD